MLLTPLEQFYRHDPEVQPHLVNVPLSLSVSGEFLLGEHGDY
jgi:hypothetical protein